MARICLTQCAMSSFPVRANTDVTSITAGNWTWFTVPYRLSSYFPRLKVLKLCAWAIICDAGSSTPVQFPELETLHLINWAHEDFCFSAPKLKHLIYEKCKLNASHARRIQALKATSEDPSSCVVEVHSRLAGPEFGWFVGTLSLFLPSSVKLRVNPIRFTLNQVIT